MKCLPWPLGLEKRSALSPPSLTELKHDKSGKRPFAATLTVNAICSSDIAISDFFFSSPVAEITTEWSRDQGKEEINKGQKETGSDISVQVGRQARDPDVLIPSNWSQQHLYGGSHEPQAWGEGPGTPNSPEWNSSTTPNLAHRKLTYCSNAICFMELR